MIVPPRDDSWLRPPAEDKYGPTFKKAVVLTGAALLAWYAWPLFVAIAIVSAMIAIAAVAFEYVVKRTRKTIAKRTEKTK